MQPATHHQRSTPITPENRPSPRPCPRAPPARKDAGAAAMLAFALRALEAAPGGADLLAGQLVDRVISSIGSATPEVRPRIALFELYAVPQWVSGPVQPSAPPSITLGANCLKAGRQVVGPGFSAQFVREPPQGALLSNTCMHPTPQTADVAVSQAPTPPEAAYPRKTTPPNTHTSNTHPNTPDG